MVEPRLWIDAVAIPPQECANRKRMPEPMDAGRSRARRHAEREPWHEVVAKGVPDRVGYNRGSPVPGKERCLGDGGSQALFTKCSVGAQPSSETWTKRNEAALTEFTVTHEEHLALQIDIAALKARDLADTQPQACEECEDRGVRRPALRCAIVIRELRRVIKYPPDRRWVIQVRQAPG